MNDAIQKLVDAVQKASPVVWAAAYRQVWIECIEAILFSVVFASIGLWFLHWVNSWRDSTDRPIGRFLGAAMCFVGFVCGIYALELALNPTFAAIKELKGLL